MSYLSPLPHYSSPSLGRSRSYSTLSTLDNSIDTWDPRLRLHHPLYSQPQRHYHLANGRQRMHQDVSTIPHFRRPSRPHAAARLRKTGYNEPVRSDIENLSDERMGRSNQRTFDGDRSNRSQFSQLECNQPGETILATPARASESRPIGNIHRYPDSLNQTISREAPLSTSSTLNSFSSSTLKNQTSSNSPPSSTSYISPYSTKYSYPTPTNNFRSYHKDDDYFNNLNSTPTKNINNNNSKTTSETVLEWTEPYDPSKPIRNAREMIHEYSTTNYVLDSSPTPPPPPPSSSIPNENNNTFEQKHKARNYLQNTLAKQLRDDGLTESQKYANQYQKTSNISSTSNNLPFDVNKIVKDSYNGDEVDHLVHQMRNNLDTTYSNPSVVQYPRRDSKSPSSSDYRIQTNNFSQNTNTITRKIMNINCG
ncbi:unnamed protein product [Caenorhabditis angaria]|uniref:Uncharacterized protein n=1 Tax=Caenorhabditis angaria TaxID=860376 RepID=A0A9P1ICB1_9PELO|nr:unnamed protein product [Caenorhabditis angaria]